jgi:antibiotic biosynthesis monooxygenase
MYAAVRQYEMGSGTVSEFMRIVDEGLAEILSGEPGFVAYHVIASGADEVVSVTVFDDEERAIRSNDLAAEFVRERLQQFQLNLTTALSGEVRVSRSGTRTTAGSGYH